jgi:uncharacterized protein (DUF1697 family)
MTCIALLRAINLAGRSQVAMSDLRELLARLGMTGARTLLQSGNVVFRGAARSTSQLERRLESEGETHLGIRTDFFVRTAAEWNAIVAGNPFPDAARQDPGHLLLMLLKKAPGVKELEALQSAISGREVVRGGTRHAYIVYPDGIGRSRLRNALVEKKLGMRGTGRNWNTVLKLQTLADQLSSSR